MWVGKLMSSLLCAVVYEVERNKKRMSVIYNINDKCSPARCDSLRLANFKKRT